MSKVPGGKGTLNNDNSKKEDKRKRTMNNDNSKKEDKEEMKSVTRQTDSNQSSNSPPTGSPSTQPTIQCKRQCQSSPKRITIMTLETLFPFTKYQGIWGGGVSGLRRLDTTV